MDRKNVLITGANRGIGLALSKAFVNKEYRVIMTGRSIEHVLNASKDLSESQIDCLEMDVNSTGSVRAAVEAFSDRYERLDVLVNNAGILASHAKVTEVSEEEINQVLETNVLGPWRTTKSFYNLLAKSDDPRIINVSSGMGALNEMGSAYFSYRLSKTALNSITAISNADFGGRIKVVSASPGWVKTDMGGSGASRSPEFAAEQIAWLADTESLEGGKFYRDKKVIEW